MIQSVHVIVSGRVQGVGYRWFVKQVATTLGVKGYVRNLPNGTVELEAEGDSESLNALIREMKKGPLGAHVQAVQEQRKTLQSASEQRFTSFEIRH
jgi:acylphosphatase